MFNFSLLKALVCFLVLAGGLNSPARAQTEIVKINWELAKLEGKNRLPFAPVGALQADPAIKFTGRLRALVTLKNVSPKKAEGLVIRYALRLRLLKAGDPQEKSFWGVPFYVEEVRVAAVNAMSERSARVLNFGISEQLRKLRNSGFTPTALKMEVMLCPRIGDAPAGIVKESVLEIQKP